MDHSAFRSWLDRYVDAWRLLDPLAIGDLFSADVRYAFDPFSEAASGVRPSSRPGSPTRTSRDRGRPTTRSSPSTATRSWHTAGRAT